MGHVLIVVGTYWLAAAFWYQLGGEPKWIWICMLPAAWIGTLGLLRNYGGWQR